MFIDVVHPHGNINHVLDQLLNSALIILHGRIQRVIIQSYGTITVTYSQEVLQVSIGEILQYKPWRICKKHSKV